MQIFRFQKAALALSLLATAPFVAMTSAPLAYGQTNTTGGIAGNVVDSTGATISGAKVTVTSLTNGETRSAVSSSNGEYRVSQLAPGRYTISAVASGFETSKQTIDVGVAGVASVNLVLTVGQNNVTVEVSASEVPLLHTDDAQISTTLTQQQVLTLPNPGNDLTFVAQTAPGSVMNTQGGYGNFSSFGLPATSNTFTVNGGYYNDPFLNLNNSGATNLTLGNNDIASVTVTSNAYNASFGGLGGAQVSENSRSGANQFHGNAAYWWNGSSMNANDYFNKQSGSPRSFDNVNQYAAAIGGPIKRDKTFFFANYEGLRVVLPSRATIFAPDTSYQNQTLANLVANGLSSEIPIYQNIFKLFNEAPGYSTAKVSTPDSTSGGYGTVQFNGSAGNFTHEYLINGRIDHNFSDKDHLFGHATIDKGVQATYTNILNPLFDALSPQPSYQGQLGETHVFGPSVSNQFLFSTIYYRAVFTNTNQAASTALVPFGLIFVDGDTGSNPSSAWAGGENFEWPQGRNVTGYQFQDDLSWTKGKHTISFGFTFRRNDVTDFSPSELTASAEVAETNASFQQGYVDSWSQQFPTRLTQPVALYTSGWYAQDQWRMTPSFTLTYGLRMEHNSNPVCITNCFAHLSSEFASTSTSTATPYNTLIASNLHQAMPSLQTIGWEPRIGFALLPFGPGSKTTVRGGFGMFADAFPGLIADTLLNNPPTNVPFTIYGPAFGGGNNPLVPIAPGSASSIAASSAKSFSAGFVSGTNFDTLSSVPGFVAPSIATTRQHLNYATYEEWSLAIEQQVGSRDSFSISYVGNRSYHEPVLNPGVNAFNGGAAGFPELGTTAPNPNFGNVLDISSAASGNFNGVVVQGQHRAHNLIVTLNYEFSHALDEISNGGFSFFGGSNTNLYPDNPFNLRDNYGNADYDTRHYVSGNYVWQVPHYWGPKLLMDNWEFSGTVFHNTGIPFSVTDSTTSNSLVNYSWQSYPGLLYAKQIAPLKQTHCSGRGAAGAGIGTPCGFASDFTTATDFGQGSRNQLYGPNYTDTDFAVTKGFVIPHWESARFRVGAQFFNLFNHYNFGLPGHDIASPSTLGVVTNGVSTPTSILGSFLGGDATPRLIQLTAKFDF
jgi:hypothetical protein